MANELVIPVIHDNGTSREELKQLRMAAYCAIDQAVDVLCKMGPNGRDYYPAPGRMEQAQAQHRRRLKVLADLMAELEAELNAIDAA